MAKVRKRLTPYQVDLDPIEITGFEITTLRLANQLEPGKFYRVTDFQTVHRLLNPTTIIRGNLEHILVLATSGSSLSKRCGSFNFPQDELEIDWTSTVAEDGTTPRAGWIVYRRDTVRNVECYFDYRNVKVRRWQFNGFDHEMGFVETSASNITLTLTWSANMSSTYLSRYRKWEIRFPAGFTHAAGPINLTITKGAFSHTRPLVRKTTMLSDWTANELASKVGPIVYSPALDAYILMDIYDVGAGQNGFFIARTNTAYTVGNGLRVLPGATYNDYLTFNGLDPTETYLGPNCSNNFFINAVSYFKLGGGSTGNSFVGRVLNSEIGAETVNNLFLNMFDWSFCMGEMTNCVLDHNTYTHLSKNPTDSNLICGPGSFNLTFEEGLVVRSLTVYAWGWGTRFSGYYNTDSFVALTGAGPNGSDVTFTKKIISSIIGYFNGDGLTFDRQFVSKYLHVKPTRVNNLESLNINALKTTPGTTELLTIDEFGNVSKRVDIPAEDPTFTPVFLFRDAPNSNDWNGCAYGNGIFVAVASSGVGNRAMSSPDGDVWTARTTPADHAWISACYGTPGFVAVAATPTTNAIMHSVDGINWTLRTVGIASGYTFVAFVNNLYVAVGDGVHITTSIDGVTWTERTGASDSAYLLKGVAYGAGLYVIVGALGPADSAVMTSPDGVTWTKRTTPVIPAGAGFDTVAYGNGMFIAYGQDGSTGFAMTSVDGISWTVLNTISEPGGGSMIFAYGLFFLIGFLEGESLQYTPEGLIWYQVPVYSEYRPWGQMTAGNGSLLSVTYSGEHKIIKSLPISINEGGFVTIETNQTISGVKTFSKPAKFLVANDLNATDFTNLYLNGPGISYFGTSGSHTNYPSIAGSVLQFGSTLNNTGSDRFTQLYSDSLQNEWYLRRVRAGASLGFNKIWHSGNVASPVSGAGLINQIGYFNPANTLKGNTGFLFIEGATPKLQAPTIEVGNGTAALPSRSFISDPDTGIYSAGANLIGFSTGGASAGTLSATLGLSIASIPAATVDTDKFLVSDGGVIKFRTGDQLRVDIGAVGGTGVANQVPYWSDANTQTGSPDLTWNDITKTFVGGNTITAKRLFDGAGTGVFRAINTHDFELRNLSVNNSYMQLLSTGEIVLGRTTTEYWRFTNSGVFQAVGAQTIQTAAGVLSIQPSGGVSTGVNITNNLNIYTVSGVTGVIRNTISNGNTVIAGGNLSSDGGNISLYGSTHATTPNLIQFRTGVVVVATIGSNQLSTIDGTAALPSRSFISDPDTGIYSAGANILGISTGGVLRVSVGAAGELTLAAIKTKATVAKAIARDSTGAIVEAEGEEVTGATVTFDSVAGNFYGNTAAISSAVTLSFTGAKLGATARVIHNAGTVPAFIASCKVLSGAYVTGVDNYIWMCLTNKTGNFVEATISQ